MPARRSSPERARARRAESTPHDDFPEALGRAIKVVRTGHDTSRRELAESAGLSYSYLSEIENGTKQPSSKALLGIAEALGMRVHELLEAAETWSGSLGEAIAEETPLTRSIGPAAPADLPPASELRYVEPWPERPRRWYHSRSSRQRSKEGSMLSSERVSELVSLFGDLTPEEQERVLEMLRSLAARE